MLNLILRNTVRFSVLVLIQVLVVNYIDLGTRVNPFLYIMYILMLPVNTPNWLILLLGFVLGISIDMFTNTLGMHTSACVFLAFVRPFVLRIMAPRDGYEFDAQPMIQSNGLLWFAGYALVLIILHHLWLFGIEYFKFSDIGFILSKTILSAIASLIIILLAQYLLFKPIKVNEI